MTERIAIEKGPARSRGYAWAVFAAMVFFMVKEIDRDLWYQLYLGYFIYLAPVLIAFSLYFKGLRGAVEVRLYMFYCLWLLISRLLNGDIFLSSDIVTVLDIGMGCAFLTACLSLDGRERQRYLDWLSILFAGYITFMSLLSMYGVLLRRELFVPITGGYMVSFTADSISRLGLFLTHPNESAMWFFLSFFLLLYLFVRKKNVLWRIAMVLGAALNYLALTATFSRNTELAFSGCAALLLALWLHKRLGLEKTGKKLICTLAVVCVALPLIYLSFTATAAGIRTASDALVSATAEQQESSGEETAETASTVETTESTYVDDRGLDDSSRFRIFSSIVPTMEREPMRLLRGALAGDVMSVANEVWNYSYSHFHNSYLQVLGLTGLPGLGLILAFTVLLVIKIVRLYFSRGPLSMKILSMVLVGSFTYNLLETSLFVWMELRGVIFYILAGALLAYFRDMEPETGTEPKSAES